MWPFGNKPCKKDLQGYRKVKAGGFVFTIRRINPLLDLPPDKIPQMFTSFQSVRPAPEKQREPKPEEMKRSVELMKAVLKAGVIDVRDGHIAAEDLFVDPEIGIKLYWEVLLHSQNRFRGIKKVFFYIKTRFWLFTTWRKITDANPLTSPIPTEVTP